jgi:Na+/melibiose symporter-like transporter
MSKQNLLSNQTFDGNNVPKLTKILYPWSGIFRDACYTLIGTFLMQYAITAGVLSTDAQVFTSQYGVITIAMMIALLWDGINDPLMGFILEKCHFKSGKFRPWIAIGAIGNAICVALMFLIPSLGLVSGWGYVGFMIAMYVIWDCFFTMNDIGYWSMLPALTNDAKQRAQLTTQTAIAATIGTFTMNILMVLLPGTFSGASTKGIYMWTGIIIAILFLASQLVVFFLCQERTRDAKQEEISEKSSILDLFRIVWKNKQLGVCAFSLLLFYFAEFILTGIGTNYFYMVFGYGGNKGGLVATVISVIYVLATLVAQAFYPMLSKRMSKQKIINIMGVIIGLAYLAFFFVAFPLFGEQPLAYNTPDAGNVLWVAGGTMCLYYIFSFLFFGATGIFYLALLVMFQDSIDYGEWKFGERKESISFAWRPLDVKLASGLNRGLQWVTFAITGTASAINAISNAEGVYNADIAAAKGNQTVIDAVTAVRDATIASAMSDVERGQLIGFGCIVIGVILVCFIASWALLHFGYKIDENMEKQIVDELEERRKKDNLETASSNAVKEETVGL